MPPLSAAVSSSEQYIAARRLFALLQQLFFCNDGTADDFFAGAFRHVDPCIFLPVGFYLSGVIPLAGIALLDLGLLWQNRSPETRLGLHASFVALFLIVAHVAMIFGMLDPTLLTGANPMAAMPGMVN